MYLWPWLPAHIGRPKLWRSAEDRAGRLGEVLQRDWVMSASYVPLSDVNECALSNTCFGGMCINTPGSYVCENCKLGFGPSADGLRCEGSLDANPVQVLTCVAVFDAYLCFQTWMSVLRRTSASAGCAPTPKAPTAVPDVRPATGSLLTGRDVKVDPICVHQLNKKQLAHPRSQLIVKIPVLRKRIPAFLHVFSCRYRWVPVFGYVCQWDLSKLRGLVYLWELPCRVQSVVWWWTLWRYVSTAPPDELPHATTCGVFLYDQLKTNAFFLILFLPRVFGSWLQRKALSRFCCLTRPHCFPSDIDECALPTTCPRGTCTNTEGSFTCITCQPGFTVSEDGQQCEGEAFSCVCIGMCLCCSKQVCVC